MGEHVRRQEDIIDPALLWRKYDLENSIGISADNYLRLCENADRNYDYRLPAHGYEHALVTADKAMALAEEYAKIGNAVNRRELFAAALLHDIRYHENHRAQWYDTKEAYSAAASAPILREAGYSPLEAARVRGLILSTRPDSQLDTVEGIILFEADMDSVGGPDEAEYEYRTALLETESEQLLGAAFRPLDYLASNIKVLAAYITKDVSFGNLVTSEWLGRCVLRAQTRLERYARESGLTLEEAVAKLDNSAVNKLQAMFSKLTSNA